MAETTASSRRNRLKDRLREWFGGLDPKKKRMYVLAAILCVFFILASVGYAIRHPEGKARQPASRNSGGSGGSVIDLNPNILKESAYLEQQKELSDARQKMQDFEKQLDDMKKEMAVPPAQATGAGTKQETAKYPPPPLPSAPQPGQQPSTFPGAQALPQSPYPREPKALEEAQVIGGIEVVSNPQPEPPPPDDKKKEEIRVYLPPSFMEGSLLSGLDCPTVESAKKDPMPALIRIKDLAVLPNAVKANLKGCFVIAQGWGSLADERAHLRLVSLSCLDKGGKSVIDQDVDGFVVDSDGKIGLSGTVVAKLGSTIARAALAGFFGGVGDFLKASTTTTQVTAAGTIQSIDTSRLATAGLGGGLSTAANELGKFYMELARQTMPVIEVGATKTITIVISKGVDLVIKEKQGIKGNEEN